MRLTRARLHSALVHHVRVPAPMSGALCSEFIASALEHDRASANALITSGAVYVQSPEERRRPARLTADVVVHEGAMVRVHHARRFPAAATMSWAPPHLVSESDDFALVDKPSGVPTHATSDNLHENVLAVLSRQRDGPLWACHRLDTPTSGLLLLAKSPPFVAHAQKLLRRSARELAGASAREQHRLEGIGRRRDRPRSPRWRKWYRALCLGSSPPPIGRAEHLQRLQPAAPHRFEPVGHGSDGARRCVLDIISATPFEHEGRACWEVVVELLTGRTHQVRGQLAELGFPLVGDGLYGAAARDEPLALQACAMRLPLLADGEELVAELPEASAWWRP